MTVNREQLQAFVKNTEKKVLPGTVGPLHNRAEMLAKLPLRVQKFIIEQGSKRDPSIGFIVEPYSFFLAYEIDDEAAARGLLPPGYELTPTSMFDGTEPRHAAILGMFNVHTSVFWGSRVELYVIAENTRTGMLSWIICGYESNTISYDPGTGFSGPSTSHSVVTTSHLGEVVIDVESAESANRIALTADITAGATTPLDQRLWVEGNLSVGYGSDLEDADADIPFALVFDPAEMREALEIPLDNVAIEHNTFGSSMVAPEPFEACCFPYAQHFLTTSFPKESALANRADLEAAVAAFNRDPTAAFKTD